MLPHTPEQPSVDRVSERLEQSRKTQAVVDGMKEIGRAVADMARFTTAMDILDRWMLNPDLKADADRHLRELEHLKADLKYADLSVSPNREEQQRLVERFNNQVQRIITRESERIEDQRASAVRESDAHEQALANHAAHAENYKQNPQPVEKFIQSYHYTHTPTAYSGSLMPAEWSEITEGLLPLTQEEIIQGDATDALESMRLVAEAQLDETQAEVGVIDRAIAWLGGDTKTLQSMRALKRRLKMIDEVHERMEDVRKDLTQQRDANPAMLSSEQIAKHTSSRATHQEHAATLQKQKEKNDLFRRGK